jgi:RNA polymerase sigma-70 factor (ECF subfamily)
LAANGAGNQALGESPYEKRLVARFQAGEPEALSALFEMHVDGVYAFARHMLANREDAEEVSSEAFMRAFERAASYRGECAFRGWLFGITRNLCLDRLRQPRLLLIEPEESERAGDDGRSSDRMDTSVDVRRALSGLPSEYQMVLKLCDVEEWNADEAAFMLEKSVQATKSLLYRARRALRDRLADVWGEPGNPNH